MQENGDDQKLLTSIEAVVKINLIEFSEVCIIEFICLIYVLSIHVFSCNVLDQLVKLA